MLEEQSERAGAAPLPGAGQGIAVAFGKTLKTLRTRAGLEREELGRRLGYSASTIASFEQGRRIPSSRTVEQTDDALSADGLLSVWKGQLEKAQYPAGFQGLVELEKTAIELLHYDKFLVSGLLQTEEYMRALFAMRRPLLDSETVERRVTSRLARQSAVFGRRPEPLSSFVLDETVLRQRYGGKQVLRGQLEHLLLIGQQPHIDIQVMPLECEENAGMGGPFTIATRKDGKQFLYFEATHQMTLVNEPENATVAAVRYGVIRSQALAPRESLEFIEKLLGEL
ncbi:helix-turn-helix domain-containing protein [Streptomyces sp. NPDC001744]|uniref:helix-turn-helix domain-containing protein n=1 Tax=Streptomyces sp. NPDC001744 TaxID=3364606 RepID=UPI0036982AC2